MLIPRYWAEYRKQGKVGKRSVTVRRFGWSNQGQAEAERHAQTRAEEAYARIESGETLARRELKRAYNGAEGVPIREEVLSTHGDAVLTRNGYGAKCLNTPNVFFADIDFDGPSSSWFWVGVLEAIGAVSFALIAVYWFEMRWRGLWIYMIIGSVLSYPVGWLIKKLLTLAAGGEERMALRGIKRFLRKRPDWNVRIYRTPAGLRLLALHQTIDPRERTTQEAFLALGADPIYVRMCQNQHCFRARVSPKPWRLSTKMDPTPPRRGVWPVAEKNLLVRAGWVRQYEAHSVGHASCSFLEETGSGIVDPAARAIQRLHDELSQAEANLPLA